jgi:hypothetical protein
MKTKNSQCFKQTVIAATLLLLGCAAQAATASSPVRGFDVNDVSMLFPLTGDVDSPLYPDIRLTAKRGDWPLMSSRLFGEIVTKFMKTSGGELAKDFASQNFVASEQPYFHVVNFRYDPCFPASADQPNSCIRQIRLIAQPFRPKEDLSAIKNTGFRKEKVNPDYAIHLLFEVGRGLPTAADPVVQDLLKLKAMVGNGTVGQPLSVYPPLVAELAKFPKGRGPIAQAIVGIIAKYVSEANLKEVTLINGDDSEDQLGTWNFVGGRIENGHWVLQKIPRYKDALLQISDFDGGIRSGDDEFDLPKPGIATVEAVRALKQKMDPSAATASLEELVQLQNPLVSHPKNIDCASCHLASVSESYARSQWGDWTKSVILKSGYQIPTGITGFADPRYLPSFEEGTFFGDVHVLGYFENAPVVTPMVAQSAAKTAATLNRILQLPAPTTADCNAPEVRACFFNKESSAQDCLGLCKQ